MSRTVVSTQMLRSKDNSQKLGLSFHCGFLKSSSNQAFVEGGFYHWATITGSIFFLSECVLNIWKLFLNWKLTRRLWDDCHVEGSIGTRFEKEKGPRTLQGLASLVVSAPRQISWELVVAVCESSGKSHTHRKEWVTWSQLGSRTKSYIGLRIPLKFTCQEEGKRSLGGAECVWTTHPNTPPSLVPN